ncbi:DUF3108 domain-containing protein [Azospirillum soli]|uniref:DUF3108 domain-containing protein n=1 Tax=Azospirillum soli TaxID=1304799 RepID=UPI001B3B62D1|nr:DUF3108 domain-containing protein [Azospirillum soli]MBP2312866.1 hypothetical protein [Azospirillum soli]
MIRARRLAAGLAWLAMLPGVAGAAVLELDFDAYGGGLALGHGTVAITVEGNRYDARLLAEASSWLGLFTNFRYGAEASGVIGTGALKPEQFRGERRLRRKLDVMALRYTAEGIEVRAEPPMSPEKAARVPVESRRGSADPLSVGAAVILAAARPGQACTGTYPVYDGRRRYDVIMTPRGREELPPSRYRLASGMAEVCSVTLHPVAGFQTDRDPSKFFARDTDRTATVWFAPAGPGGRAVPATVEVAMDSGTVLVQVVAVRERP